MANPAPNQTEAFKAQQQTWKGGENFGEPSASAPIATRYPESVDRLLRDMPDRAAFIRSAVIEKLADRLPPGYGSK